MEHSFDIDIAQEYGIGCAIILKHLYYWIRKNQVCEKNFHDGKYWTYGSTKAFSELFPYFGDKQLRNIFQKMEELGLIEIGNYNTTPFDRTKWYTLTEKGFDLIENKNSTSRKDDSESAKGQLPFGERANEIRQKDGAIPNIYTNNITDINTNNICYCTHNDKKANEKEKSSSRFIPPTVEQVKAYCHERKNNISPEIFCDYYASKGWMIGRNKMKDWKAAVRTWERNEYYKPKTGATGVELDGEIDHSLDGIF